SVLYRTYLCIHHLFLFSIFSRSTRSFSFFFFNDTPPTEIYTLSLHDALPISSSISISGAPVSGEWMLPSAQYMGLPSAMSIHSRSEEHTSELQSHLNLVCRLLLEKKKKFNCDINKYIKNYMLHIRYSFPREA